MARRREDFQTIRSEGGLLPPDLLRRVIDPNGKLGGTQPEDYSLAPDERLSDVITQSWSRLRKRWEEFRRSAMDLPDGEAGTGLTNDKWSLPLLQDLGFGLLPTSAGPEIGGRTFALSRFFGPVPIHLVGCGLSLDRRTAGARGAAAANPHGLVQEFLNRSPGHLWAIVSNGLHFRILRDSQALSRQSFLEFDLEAMFSGEVYSDFVLFWLVAHASRFAPHETDHPETCWLEYWSKLASEQGTRALGDLRGGVENALQVLGEGFTSHQKNTGLRDALREGRLSPADLHGQLLRAVYRLIFLFVAEDRNLDGQPLLHPRDDSDAGRKGRGRYAAHYSTGRLREMASEIKGSRHGDLWRQFQTVIGALSGDDGFATARKELSLPALGSLLWDPSSTPALNDSQLTNFDFLESIRCLAYTHQGKVLRPVDYRNLGAEELGGVYESLLGLTPQISADGVRFTFAEFAGSERKTSGSYYTPDSLVQCLLDSALDPVVMQATENKPAADVEKAILDLKVCDPAVGSGHFLVAAAHRLARHLARVRALAQGESEPSPLIYQQALRKVIGRCLYGVDLNPMAVELCRVSLWLEALEPGKPLSFLDHHIRLGNSLMGTTPDLIAAGLPDGAFSPIEGDEKTICAALRKRNMREREGGQLDMLHLMAAEPKAKYNSIRRRVLGIDEAPDSTIVEIQQKAGEYQRLLVSPEYQHGWNVADTWCAAFVWKKTNYAAVEPITSDTIYRFERDPEALTMPQLREVQRLSTQYQFFHWHLAFPDVFGQTGFDCVLGNPPWERVNLKEQEWFSRRSPEIADAPNAAARKRMIAQLRTLDPHLYTQFTDDSRRADGEGHFLHNSGLYPLCGRGDINVYAVFAEKMRALTKRGGLVGCILPTGIATDDTTKFFFQDLVEKRSLVSLFDFENKKFFPSVDSRYKFSLLTYGKTTALPKNAAAQFVFFAHTLEDLCISERRFTLSIEEIAKLNPNTRTCPIFRSTHDAELTKAIYRRTSILLGEAPSGADNTWNIEIGRMFHTSDDSSLFCSDDGPTTLRLYEAKCFWHFDHRYATYSAGDYCEVSDLQKQDPRYAIDVRYRIERGNIPSKFLQRLSPWHLSFRKISNATNARTLVVSITPESGLLDSGNNIYTTSAIDAACLAGSLNSFIIDYVARQKMGGSNMTVGVISQLPNMPPGTYARGQPWINDKLELRRWLLPRVLELVYTAWDLETFAHSCGWLGPPFRWDRERRFLIRCELDAMFFSLYLPAREDGDWHSTQAESAEELARLKKSFPTPRDAIGYIMDTFPIVRRKDEDEYKGEFRTKSAILKIYDAIVESIRAGRAYMSPLEPPPGPPAVDLPAWKPGKPKPSSWPSHIHFPRECE